ncbi:tetratricopeptide repeat protein, partial [Helicobacter pylori]
MSVKILKILVCGLFFWSLNTHLWGKRDNSFLGVAERAYKSGNYSKATSYFKKACNDGVSEGCTQLGIIYENGQGTRIDYKKALEYYKTACQADDREGCFGLGGLYDDGLGTTQNYQEAIDAY